MDESPNPDENEEPGHDWAFFAIRIKKRVVEGLVGLMAGDALIVRKKKALFATVNSPSVDLVSFIMP
jgi:hypothetical protein